MHRYFHSPTQTYISLKQDINHGAHQTKRYHFVVYPVKVNMHLYYKCEYWLIPEHALWCDTNLSGKYLVERGEAEIAGVKINGGLAAFENMEDAENFRKKWYPESGIIDAAENVAKKSNLSNLFRKICGKL